MDFTGPVGHNYLHQGQVRPCTGGESWHKTMVASVAASYHDTYTGVAPDAVIYDACTDGTDEDTVDGLSWATARADPINASIGFQADGQMNFTDKAFDYWARKGYDTVTKSAGNNGGYITSPGKGWNVITVGAYDDKNNSKWSDDEMWPDSSWRDPTGREKPEVVAPGVSITAIELNNNLLTKTGTSFAAPQVAGLAALLMERNISLAQAPNAVKAIIMASAVHNIEGDSRLSEKDGAGAIVGVLADEIAMTRGSENTTPCNSSCWWNKYITPSNFPNGTYLNRYFRASQGERVRVVITWWSYAYCPDKDNCNFDRLDTDIDLKVYDPNGAFVTSSDSASNNYEIVEFTAPKTGKYRIGAYRFSLNPPPNGETFNYLGIAWVRDATYLPDVRSSYNGWDSEIIIRNDGPLAREVRVTLFDSGGSFVGDEPHSLDPNNAWRYNPSYGNFIGSAIINAGEDMSVVVESRKGSSAYAYNGVAGVDPNNPGWGEGGAALYAPVIVDDFYDWYSPLVLYNPGSNTVSVDIEYYRSGSGYVETKRYSIDPNASEEIQYQGDPDVFYSARIISLSSQLHAGITYQYNNDTYETYNVAG